jgi:hypothetical protein
MKSERKDNQASATPNKNDNRFPRGFTMHNATTSATKAMRMIRHARATVSVITIGAMVATAVPAYAAIDNTATANGTPSRGTYTPVTDDASVDVAPAERNLSVVKNISGTTTAAGTAGIVDTGDTITYRYVIENTGTVTLTNVLPVDAGPTFNGTAGTNSLVGFTHQPTDPSNTTGVVPASVAPGEIVVFTATYTLSQLDYLRGAQVFNGVDNSATAEARDGGGAIIPLDNPVTPSTVEYDLPAAPNLQITKVATLIETNGNTTDGLAEVGDEITYTYTVLNTGNVPMNDVAISDDHENGDPGAVILNSATGTIGTGFGQWQLAEDTGVTPTLGTNSDDAADGDYDVLAVGGQIIFTYRHQVTQLEFDAQ